jgi:hypothetical protein
LLTLYSKTICCDRMIIRKYPGPFTVSGSALLPLTAKLEGIGFGLYEQGADRCHNSNSRLRGLRASSVALQQRLDDLQERLEFHVIRHRAYQAEGPVKVVNRQLGDNGHFELIRGAGAAEWKHPSGGRYGI